MARGDRGDRDRERERGRDGREERGRPTRSEAREDVESLRTRVDKVAEKLERTSHLALQASKDSGEVRAAHQLVVFAKGLVREHLKEVVALYQSERDAVLQGLKDKGAPLKVRVYEALLKKLGEFAATKGAETVAVAKELLELGANSVVNSVTNGAKPPEGDVPWVLVLTFHYSELGQKAKRLWCSAALRPCFAKTGGGWPELGVREGSWRPGRLHQAVAEDLGLPPKGRQFGNHLLDRRSPDRCDTLREGSSDQAVGFVYSATRANRTRTQQLDLGELVPGVTRIDFHRETQGDVGWRGPAELLQINKDEGTAIISYQGRPYLVSLRHIRPHQAGVFVAITGAQEASFLELQKLAEQLSPYKAVTIGWDLWPKIVSLSRALSSHTVGGMMAGQALRALHPPKGSVGVLLMWERGERQFSCHEHNNDQVIVFKKISAKAVETIIFIYVYYYVNVEYKPQKEMKIVPSEGAADVTPMDGEPMPSEGDNGPGGQDAVMESATFADPRPAPSPMEEDDLTEDRKRKGPETRTVVLGPEAKKSKVCSLVHLVQSEKVFHQSQHVLINLYWIMHWTQAIPMDFPMTWYGMDNNVPVAQWDIHTSKSWDDMTDEPKHARPGYLFTWPGKHHEELFASLQDGQIYKLDDETDNILEDEVYTIWEQVEEADEAEIKQFVETDSFNKAHKDFLDDDTVIIGAVWVRKWKRCPDGTRRVKSRLCARGCFDRQKDMLSTRSTTATRLSQRLLLSTAANKDLEVESWDIGGAFLKGMNFEAVRKLLESKGIKSPKRKIAIIAPANVWRHLAKFNAKFKLEPHQLENYVLICIKPVYGLSDAPLAWQLCLHGHLEEQGGRPSLMDENLFYWSEPPSYRTKAMVTTHMDDCGSAGKAEWLTKQYNLLLAKFGKVTRQKLPFVHCGVQYSRKGDGFHMSQDDFCGKLKTTTIAKDKKDDDALSPQELTTFRSILGGLLWLTATRLDSVADVCLLQSNVTRAKIHHLRQANNVVAKPRQRLAKV
eukprot:s1424_g6.t1